MLEIGTGCWYQDAILSQLCQEVYTIELLMELGMIVEEKFKEFGYNNIHAKIGDGNQGWKDTSLQL